MTVYVSRKAMASQSRCPEPRRPFSQGPVRRANPRLLTFVWRRLFGHQVREDGRR